MKTLSKLADGNDTIMTASIYDVAKRAGVSISTVSRIMNGSANVSEVKKAAVQEAMDFYQYEPNQFARGLVKQRSNMIGIYFPMASSSMFGSSYNLELLKGIEKVLTYQNYNMVLINEMEGYRNRSKATPKYLEFVRQKRIDGLILSGLSDKAMREAVFKQIMDEEYPLVYIGKRIHLKGLNVYAQFEQYSLRMIDVLRQQNHRRVLYYVMEGHQHYLQEILKKVAEQMPEMELWPIIVPDYNSEREDILYQTNRYVRESGCSAILSPGMEMTQMLIGICAQLGLAVPQEVSILSVEHKQGEGEMLFPRISAFCVPAGNMGSGAAELLLRAIQGEAIEERSIEYETRYTERDSIRRLIQN